MRVLAIDQGTTSTRALTLDESGAMRLSESIGHAQRHPASGWVEQDPDELLGNIRTLLDDAGPVDAICIDNQGESCLAWDAKSGRPISPVIVWQDNRTHAVAERLKEEAAEQTTIARAGLPLDPYFSATKLAWILENVPEARRLRRKGRLRMGTTDAFFLDRLAGVFATDTTTASRTSLMSLRSLQWDEELCRLFGVPADALPEIRPTVGDFGSVRVGRRQVDVRVSVVDQQASLFGHGCRAAGDAKITFGTGAFALSLSGTQPVDPGDSGLLPTVAWSRSDGLCEYAVDAGVYNAGSAVEWARRNGLLSDPEALGDADGDGAIDKGLVFVPALSGLACPHWDRSAAGLWIGMSLETSRADLGRSILEGIAFRTAEAVAAMDAACPISQPVSIDGGLSRNAYFCQFLADVLERTIAVPKLTELTVLGCAALALDWDVNARELVGSTARVDPRRRDTVEMKRRFSAARQRAARWR